MRMTCFVLSLSVVLFGCAGVDVAAVKMEDQSTAGFRYFLPKPCLLVTPPSPASVRIDFIAGKSVIVQKTGGAARIELGKVLGLDPASTIEVGISDEKFLKFQKPTRPQTTVAIVDAASKTAYVDVLFNASVPAEGAQVTLTASFGTQPLGSGEYQLSDSNGDIQVVSKSSQARSTASVSVIYLPDREHPLAVEPVEGLGGISELQLTLKDGWMLTNVGTKTDTQADETITAVATLIEKVGGVAFGAAIRGGAGRAAGAGVGIPEPGLYCAEYDSGGKLDGFSRVPLH